jgi:hypothetical protein
VGIIRFYGCGWFGWFVEVFVCLLWWFDIASTEAPEEGPVHQRRVATHPHAGPKALLRISLAY